MMFDYGQTSERTRKIRALIERVSSLGSSPHTSIADLRVVISDIENNYNDIDDVFVSAAQSLLMEIEADGEISQEERNLLSSFISIFDNPISDEPITAIEGRDFVLTGDFAVEGGKGVVEEMITAGGGIVKTGVSRKTSYVVVGALGSDAWSFDGFGNKVKRALDLQLTNKAKVLVVSEEAFLAFAERNSESAQEVLEEQFERFRKQRESVRVVPNNFSGYTTGQQEVLDLVEDGNNVYLTGLGGTGKSFILEKIIERAQAEEKNVIACAPTGIAALNIGGSTIHRVLDIRPNKTLSLVVAPWINDNSPLLSCDLMIVDEISMCRLDLFDYLSLALKAASKLRRDGKPLCQLVVVGDFCQLPPVLKAEDRPILEQKYGYEVGEGYAFMGAEWDSWEFKKVELTEAIRQRDSSFVAALNACRVGDTKGLEWIEDHAAKHELDNAIILCGLNRKVDAENEKNLAKLPSESHYYYAESEGQVEPGDKPTLDTLEIKVGARVMALVNDSEKTYMNGSLGTVIDCDDDFVVACFDNGAIVQVGPHRWDVTRPTMSGGKTRNETIGTFTQLPLKLAYAITIHKAQGQTFEAASIYPDCWDPGQLYTALSRLTTIEGMHLMHHIQDGFLKTSKDVVRFNEGKAIEHKEVKIRPIIEDETPAEDPAGESKPAEEYRSLFDEPIPSKQAPHKWTPDEESFLMADTTHTNRELAGMLGVSIKSIERKKSKLRKASLETIA